MEKKVFESYLQSLVNGDMISIKDVSDLYEKMKKNKVLQVHRFQITHPTEKKGSRWMTYYIDKEGIKRKLARTTEESLFDKLYEIYFIDLKKVTITDLFSDFLSERTEQGLEPATIQRYKNYWCRYYLSDPIVKKDITKVTSDEIEKFFYKSIQKYQMTVRELSNMKVILKDIMKIAKKKQYIMENPFDNVEIRLNGCRPQKKKKKTERVYLPDEKEKLFSQINKDIEENNITNGFALFLEFKLGLRIGELSALTWEDIDYESRTIHIHRTEAMGNDRKRIVADHVKLKSETGDRYLPISDYELFIFNRIKELNKKNKYKEKEYIFCNENGRMTSRQIDNYLRKMCRRAKIAEKSIHDIRRSVASEMFKNKVSIEVIRVFLGHSDIKTTFSYIYDCESEEKTKKIIISALNGNNGLKNVLACTCA